MKKTQRFTSALANGVSENGHRYYTQIKINVKHSGAIFEKKINRKKMM